MSDTTRVLLTVSAGLAAFAGSLGAGYAVLRSVPSTLEDDAPGDAHPTGDWRTCLPFCGGLAGGLAIVWAGLGAIVPGDRFNTPSAAGRILPALLVGLATFVMSSYMGRRKSIALARDEISSPHRIVPSVPIWQRWMLPALLEIGAALLIALAGVRFNILGLGGGTAVDLGVWGVPLTVLWLLTAISAVRVLDGIHGAASVLLLTSSVAVFFAARGGHEPVLTAISVAVFGATLGSLRFHFFPAPLPLYGASSAAFGYMFAILTVAARQKTVAALLLVFPLAVVVMLLGSLMLRMLEKTVFLPASGGSDRGSDDLGRGDK